MVMIGVVPERSSCLIRVRGGARNIELRSTSTHRHGTRRRVGPFRKGSSMSKLVNIAAAIAAVATVALGSGLAHAQVHADTEAALFDAHFEGATIDLSESWGDATSCAELDGAVYCYRTESQLLEAHPELDDQTSVGVDAMTTTDGVSLASGCSTALRLYSGTGYSGNALYLTSRYLTINLSTYGFDNLTSSYRVGACATAFYSGTNLSGSQYPGSTGAWASASTMATGWNNVVSSVIIY